MPGDLRGLLQRLGVTLRRVMTDNGPCYTSRAFAAACRRFGVRHVRTKPCTPRTNGKAERFIQTAMPEWAYARTYETSEQRAADFPARIPGAPSRAPGFAPSMRAWRGNRAHGPPSGAVQAGIPARNLPLPGRQAAASRPIRTTFSARHARSHSPRALASPRTLKRRKPIASLIQPFGASESHLRLA